jgi:hypothetical protein
MEHQTSGHREWFELERSASVTVSRAEIQGVCVPEEKKMQRRTNTRAPRGSQEVQSPRRRKAR